ncbi:MAG TPA: hypothetical protein VNO70_11295, partial [Blastocatellia bacterium]|nr:hypothetical protein [Blastocatellia bacterium]
MKRKPGLPVAPMARAVIALLTVLPSTAEACLEEEFSCSVHWNLSYLILSIVRIDLLIMPVQLASRRSNRELPVDLDGFLLSLFDN